MEVVRHGCNHQALHIRPLCFEKHQPLFLKPCLQHSRALQCADTIISYSKPFTTAIFPHPDKEKEGGKRIRTPNFFPIYLHLKGMCLNFQGLVRWEVQGFLFFFLFFIGMLWSSWCSFWTSFNTLPPQLMIHGRMAYDPLSSIQIV